MLINQLLNEAAIPKSFYLRIKDEDASHVEKSGAKAKAGDKKNSLTADSAVDVTTLKRGAPGFTTYSLDLTKLDISKFKKIGGGWWRYAGNIPASALKKIS